MPKLSLACVLLSIPSSVASCSFPYIRPHKSHFQYSIEDHKLVPPNASANEKRKREIIKPIKSRVHSLLVFELALFSIFIYISFRYRNEYNVKSKCYVHILRVCSMKEDARSFKQKKIMQEGTSTRTVANAEE